jgi:hypothetical protein
MPFFFVSAADGTNVVQMFEHAIKVAWAHKKDPVRVQWLLVQTASEIGRVSSSAPPARLTPWLCKMSCSFFFSFAASFDAAPNGPGRGSERPPCDDCALLCVRALSVRGLLQAGDFMTDVMNLLGETGKEGEGKAGGGGGGGSKTTESKSAGK